jgi:hypothetical protein
VLLRGWVKTFGSTLFHYLPILLLDLGVVVPSHMPSVDSLRSHDSPTPSRKPIGPMVFVHVATTNAAMFHALMCTVASNFTTAQGGRRPRYWEIYHRGEALRLINAALSNPVEAATIAAILYVSGFEVSPKSTCHTPISQLS